jgi:hypothetical protein
VTPMWLLLLPLVHAMVLPLDPGGGKCSYAVDCNSRACQDCSCDGGACQCADGFSGPNCGVAFCNATLGCSGHGTCHQTAHSMSCECDAGYKGARCAASTCKITCFHGGQCDPKQGKNATTCTGCEGGWTGPTCSTWDSSYPAGQRTARLVQLKNLSLSALNKDLTYNPICRKNSECVGWGVDLSTGRVATGNLLFLDFTQVCRQLSTHPPRPAPPALLLRQPCLPTHNSPRPLPLSPRASSSPRQATPTYLGKKYPAGVDVKPHESPAEGTPDPHAFKNYADYANYVIALWANQTNLPGGFYARNLSAVRDGVFNDGSDCSAYITQAPYVTVDMAVTSNLSLDLHAQRALDGLGAWADDADSWRSFFGFWGTSVVTTARLGGLTQTVSKAATALNADHDSAWMRDQALCSFQTKTGIGGSCTSPSHLFTEYVKSTELSCFGGDPTKCLAGEMPAWMSSVDAAPVLLDYSAQAFSPFISAASGAAAAAAFDVAEAAYLLEQKAKRPDPKVQPGTCNGNGTVGPETCTCDSKCFTGRECSVFNYEGGPAAKSMIMTGSAYPAAHGRHHCLEHYDFSESCDPPFWQNVCATGGGHEMHDCLWMCKFKEGLVHACTEGECTVGTIEQATSAKACSNGFFKQLKCFADPP